MSEELKSAFELAMERLRRQDGKDPVSQPLSEAQKREIGALRDTYRARRAEKEILHRAAREQARRACDPEKTRQLEDGFARDMARLAEEEEAAVRRLRE